MLVNSIIYRPCLFNPTGSKFIFTLHLCCLVYRLVLIPPLICVIFYTLNSGFHSQNTRFALYHDFLSFSIHHSAKFRCAFSYIAVKLCVPPLLSICSASSFSSFRRYLISYFLRSVDGLSYGHKYVLASASFLSLFALLLYTTIY